MTYAIIETGGQLTVEPGRFYDEDTYLSNLTRQSSLETVIVSAAIGDRTYGSTLH